MVVLEFPILHSITKFQGHRSMCFRELDVFSFLLYMGVVAILVM